MTMAHWLEESDMYIDNENNNETYKNVRTWQSEYIKYIFSLSYVGSTEI